MYAFVSGHECALDFDLVQLFVIDREPLTESILVLVYLFSIGLLSGADPAVVAAIDLCFEFVRTPWGSFPKQEQKLK